MTIEFWVKAGHPDGSEARDLKIGETVLDFKILDIIPPDDLKGKYKVKVLNTKTKKEYLLEQAKKTYYE